jgi:hypothetical protein
MKNSFIRRWLRPVWPRSGPDLEALPLALAGLDELPGVGRVDVVVRRAGVEHQQD